MPRSRSRRKATKSNINQGRNYPKTSPHVETAFLRHSDRSASVKVYWFSIKLADRGPVYRAQSLDGEWFRSHPHRLHRIRNAIVGEFPNVTPNTYVVVRQVKPGYHERVPVDALEPVPDGEAPEYVAHALFDHIAESPDGVIRQDELAARMHAYQMGTEAEGSSVERPQTVH